MVGEGIAWDAVRVFFAVPLFIITFVFYLRGSLRGTLLFIGMVANFFYQYLLWAIGWAFNPHFLIYIILLICGQNSDLPAAAGSPTPRSAYGFSKAAPDCFPASASNDPSRCSSCQTQ